MNLEIGARPQQNFPLSGQSYSMEWETASNTDERTPGAKHH